MRRSGSSTAPIVVNERTVTLRARTWSVPLQIGDTRAVYVRARPDHVEVLEPDGRHVTIRVHNINTIAHRAIIAGAFAVTLATRMRRNKKRSRS